MFLNYGDEKGGTCTAVNYIYNLSAVDLNTYNCICDTGLYAYRINMLQVGGLIICLQQQDGRQMRY